MLVYFLNNMRHMTITATQYLLFKGYKIMFGIFFKKNSDQNFIFHKDRMEKLLEKALNNFIRSDKYLNNEGFGGDSIKISSAQGATGKAHSALKEAIWNVQEAIKYSKNDYEKISQIKNLVTVFTTMKGEKIFLHPSIVKEWDAAMKQWSGEFNQLL